jgi:hypothetical protein
MVFWGNGHKSTKPDVPSETGAQAALLLAILTKNGCNRYDGRASKRLRESQKKDRVILFVMD